MNWVGIDGYYSTPATLSSPVRSHHHRRPRADRRPHPHRRDGRHPVVGQPTKIADLFAGIRLYGLLGFVWFNEDTEGRSWTITSPSAFGAYQRDARAFFRPSASAP